MVIAPVLLVAAASWYGVERPMIAWAARPRESRRARRRAEQLSRAQLEARAAP
jgi:peptidoglycan/LPS O-acetylase OafA/YrhL